MTTDIGLARIAADELQVRAMAHHADSVKRSAERNGRARREQEHWARSTAAVRLTQVLHLDRAIDPMDMGTGGPGQFTAIVDHLMFTVSTDPVDYGAYPVVVWLPCQAPDHDGHDWLVEDLARLGGLLTDPPEHEDWVLEQAPEPTEAEHFVPSPEQVLLDAIRLFIQTEIEEKP